MVDISGQARDSCVRVAKLLCFVFEKKVPMYICREGRKCGHASAALIGSELRTNTKLISPITV